MIKLTLSGLIGWEILPENIKNYLEKAKGEDLEVHLVSPGGGVMSGIEIYNLFLDYKRKYPKSQNILMIKGFVASMATYLAMNPAFDLVAAEENTPWMIHNASGGAYGDYREMKTFYEALEGLTNIIAKAYSKKTKKSLKDIREMMDNETWLFGNEILEAGFIDEMISSKLKKRKKAEAVAEAKIEFTNMSKRINESENSFDITKIAAMLNPKKEQKPADVVAGNNKTEVNSMTLKEFLEQNPTAKTEIDDMFKDKLGDEYKAGFKAGKEEAQKRIKAVSKYLDPGSTYGSPVKKTAIDVLKGEKSVEALETLVDAIDAFKEETASVAAREETAVLGETPGEHVPQPSATGEIKNDIDFQAIVNEAKIEKGMEVT